MPRKIKQTKTTHEAIPPVSVDLDAVFKDTVGRRYLGGKNPRAIRGRRAALQGIMNMPMDVIYEICLDLQPKDLLSLARSSKALHARFMSRNTLFVWEAAFSNVPGMPPCPEDLSPPAYASLMFDTFCMHCLRKGCARSNVLWECRLRLCLTCAKEKSVPAWSAERKVPLDVLTLLNKIGHSVYRYLPTFTLCKRPTEPRKYIPHIESLASLVMRTPPEELEAVLAVEKRLIDIRRETWRELEEWHTAKKKAISTDRGELRASRLEAIRAKLVKMGWKTEIEYLVNNNYDMCRKFEKLPQVYRSQELTSEGWVTIEKVMVEFMEKTKEARFADARADIVVSRLKELRGLAEKSVSRVRGLTLKLREVAACIPEVAQVLDPKITHFDIDGLQQKLPVWISTYLQKRDKSAQDALAQMIKDKCDLDPLCDPFSLAVGTIFVCVECRTGRSLHLAIRHHCRTESQHTPVSANEEQKEYQRTVKSFCDKSHFYEPFWHESAYAAGLARMVEIIRICGLDVKTATVEDLDKAGIVLQATPNPRWTRRNNDGTISWSIPIMQWRTAVVGTKEYFPDKYKISAATEEQIAATKDLFPASQTRLWDSWNAEAQFCCGLCSTIKPTSRQSVLAHLEQEHGIFEPTEDECLDRHLPIPVADPVYLVAKHYRKNTLWQHSRFVRHNLFENGVAAFFNFAETGKV